MKRFIFYLIFFIVLPVILFLKFVPKHYYICYLQKKDLSSINFESSNWQKLIVKSGSTIQQIADLLKERNLLDDKDYFLCYVKKEKLNLQAGTYYIPPKTNLQNILEMLQHPEDPYVHVTFPEGLRYDQVAYKLEQVFAPIPFSDIKKELFENQASKVAPSLREKYVFLQDNNIKNLEGFLFPDSYDFEKDADVEAILTSFLNVFDKKAWPYLKQAQEKLGLSPYDALKIASIVEREANKDYEEKRMIADIIYRRLKNDWLLQTDAVLLYYYKNWTKTLTYQDLHENTPYNVYLHKGLPPTPICNPGLDSIKAVINHKPNPYWYYMHDKQGNIHYSVTFNQHLVNVNTYLR